MGAASTRRVISSAAERISGDPTIWPRSPDAAVPDGVGGGGDRLGEDPDDLAQSGLDRVDGVVVVPVPCGPSSIAITSPSASEPVSMSGASRSRRPVR